jgi:hypothetical protein
MPLLLRTRKSHAPDPANRPRLFLLPNPGLPPLQGDPRSPSDNPAIPENHATPLSIRVVRRLFRLLEGLM